MIRFKGFVTLKLINKKVRVKAARQTKKIRIRPDGLFPPHCPTKVKETVDTKKPAAAIRKSLVGRFLPKMVKRTTSRPITMATLIPKAIKRLFIVNASFLFLIEDSLLQAAGNALAVHVQLGN